MKERVASPVWLRLLPPTFALFLAATGIANLIGWVTGERSLLAPFATLPQVQPNGAVCLTAAGLGLFALSRGHTAVAVSLTFISGLLSGAELMIHMLGSETGLEWLTAPFVTSSLGLSPRQIPPNVALGFALGAAAVVVAPRHPPGGAVLASATTTLGLVALLGYGTGVPEAFAWGDRTPMSPAQSAAMLVYGLGVVLFALQSDPGGTRAWLDWAPLLAGVVGTLCGILFWQALRMNEVQQSLAKTDAVAYGVARELESSISSAASTLRILAWNVANRSVESDDDWAANAQLAMAGFGGFEAVELIDGDFHRRRVAASTLARRPVDPSPSVGEALSEQLSALSRDKRAVAVLPFRFADGAPGLRVVVRMGSQAEQRGYMAGILDTELVFAEAADQVAAAYALDLSCDGTRLLASDSTRVAASKPKWRREVALRLAGPAECRLAATPRPGFLDMRGSGLAELVLVASLAISALLSLALRFAALASLRATGLEAEVRGRTAALREALASLRSENEQRRRSEDTLQRALAMTILVSGEQNVEDVVQSVTEAAADLTGAAWGAFFYHPLAAGDGGVRYTLSGTSPEEFSAYALPIATDLIAASLRGREILRLDDVTQASLNGGNGLSAPDPPPLRVASCLAVPVRSRAGNVWGAIVVGHPDAGAFTKRDEYIAAGMAAEASIALDHARAYAVETALKVDAEAANAAKDRFLAMLSHELRNPLGSLRTALDVADRERTMPVIRRRMQSVARKQVDHLTHMVDDLLDVSRIEGGKLALTLRRVDLSRLTREAVDADARRITEHGLDLHLELARGPVWIDADPTRMAQIAGNLLDNSSKFTPKGGSITVSVTVDDTTNEAVLVVADTGAGISASERKRVFEPFVQMEQALDRAAGGLGLGLAVVKGLVDAHGGTIAAQSDGVGCGASFVLRFPLKGPPRERNESTIPRSSAEALVVLIIDDHRDSVEGLVELLEQYGHTVLAAYDGQEGLEIAKTRHPALVICDLGLPTIDGYEVARALRQYQSTAAITLFALTGYGDGDAIRRALDAGFDRHLIKPVDPALLLQLVATVAAE